MDVNRDNFYDVLPEILEKIEQADFIAIDGEFSGILQFNNLKYFDTTAERYQRHYNSDRHYMLIQMGLATVRCLDKENHNYSMSAYNFYLFPENEFDAFDFRCKTSSLQFLASNKFDFTQLFLKGIPFVCKTQHLAKQRAIRRSNKKDDENDPSQPTFVSDAELLKNTMTGFSTVIWKIQESGKLIVGHNMHMDVFHVINQFFTPLPETHEEYRTIVRSLFPKMIDTKLVASLPIFEKLIPNSALQAVYQSVRENVFPTCDFNVPENFKYALNGYEHTAGYDATCTAVIFTKMFAYINRQCQLTENSDSLPIEQTLNGKLFFMRSFDIQYVDFYGEETLPNRSFVFYVKHPGKLSNSQLKEFCQTAEVRTYERLDPTTTMIGFSMKNESCESILTRLRSNDKQFSIFPYDEFRQMNSIGRNSSIFESKTFKRARIDNEEKEEENCSSNRSFSKLETTKTTEERKRDQTNRTYDDVGETNPSKLSPSLKKLLEEKEKSLRHQKPKLFDYDDEW